MPSFCKASKVSSEEEDGKSYSYPSTSLFWSRKIFFFSSGRAPMKVGTQKRVFYNTCQTGKIFLALEHTEGCAKR